MSICTCVSTCVNTCVRVCMCVCVRVRVCPRFAVPRTNGGAKPPTGKQAATLVIFSSARQFLFSFFFAAVGSTFGYDNFGFLTGLANGTHTHTRTHTHTYARTHARARALSLTHTLMTTLASSRTSPTYLFVTLTLTLANIGISAGVLLLNAPLYAYTAPAFTGVCLCVCAHVTGCLK